MTFGFGLAIAIALFTFLSSAIKILQEYERVVVFQFGRSIGVK